jgi:hypothetical protein
MKQATTLKRGAGLIVCLLCLGGCSTAPVQPWQKGMLAKSGMLFDRDKLESAYAEHTYASKEGAAGGAGVGGGGCGCN